MNTLLIFNYNNQVISKKLTKFFNIFFLKYFFLNKLLILETSANILTNLTQLHVLTKKETNSLKKNTPNFYKYKYNQIIYSSAFNQISRVKIPLIKKQRKFRNLSRFIWTQIHKISIIKYSLFIKINRITNMSLILSNPLLTNATPTTNLINLFTSDLKSTFIDKNQYNLMVLKLRIQLHEKLKNKFAKKTAHSLYTKIRLTSAKPKKIKRNKKFIKRLYKRTKHLINIIKSNYYPIISYFHNYFNNTFTTKFSISYFKYLGNTNTITLDRFDYLDLYTEREFDLNCYNKQIMSLQNFHFNNNSQFLDNFDQTFYLYNKSVELNSNFKNKRINSIINLQKNYFNKINNIDVTTNLQKYFKVTQTSDNILLNNFFQEIFTNVELHEVLNEEKLNIWSFLEKIIYSPLKIRILSADKKNNYLFDLKSLHNDSPYKYNIINLNYNNENYQRKNYNIFILTLIFVKNLNLIIKILTIN